jgi:type IV secretory pathway VirB10-like protein
MSGEVSYFSRFFVKFVEVIAAGVATAISAYLLAHFGGLLPPPSTPVSAPAPTAVQVGPTASEVAESRRAQPTPPVAAAAVNEQRAVPQQDTDAPVAQPALKPVTDAKALPPRKRTKTDTSVSEKEPRQKSAEALARAALANVDANRSPPAPPPSRRNDGFPAAPRRGVIACACGISSATRFRMRRTSAS